MKRIGILLLIVLMILSLAGCGNKETSSDVQQGDKPIVIRVGHTLAPDSHYHKGLEKFAELLKEKSNGKIELQIFHSAQLGSERDVIEGVSMGTIEMTLVSTAPLANFSPKFMVFDLPFIIQDRETAFAAMDGEMGREMMASLEPKGIKGLGFWENGFRMLTNSKRPIEKPEDIRGLKIRLMENPVHVATFKTLGADPVPMPFGELFTALQQKTVDGQENPLVIIDTSKFYEVQDYLALAGHFYAPAALLINKAFFEGLSPELQNIIIEAEKEARQYERQYCIDLEKSLVKKLEEKGMTITRPDKTELMKAVEPVYKEFEDRIGKDVIDALRK